MAFVEFGVFSAFVAEVVEAFVESSLAFVAVEEAV